MIHTSVEERSAPAVDPAHGAVPAHSGSSLPFPPLECELLHAQDRKAAAAVAGIMIAIFTAAVFGYSVIAFLALRGPS